LHRYSKSIADKLRKLESEVNKSCTLFPIGPLSPISAHQVLSYTLERLGGMTTIKASKAGAVEKARYADYNGRLCGLAARRHAAQARLMGCLNLMTNASLMCVLAVGGR
jgi:ABC-type multidrug transport system fused ATPase/permease subunit